MGSKKTKEKEYAKLLFVNERLNQKEVAERVGVSERTIGKWANEDKWDTFRKSLLTTKQTQLSRFYNQLDALNSDIETREKKVPTNTEADTISKITSAIQKLEVETNAGIIMEVMKEMIDFVKELDFEMAKKITSYADMFIQSKIK
jgi:transcriptional regulator with XRE-family HTH domain